MSTVTIAWLAVKTAPAGELGVFVGLSVAASPLGTAIGGPIVASTTLAASGSATILLAITTALAWQREYAP